MEFYSDRGYDFLEMEARHETVQDKGLVVAVSGCLSGGDKIFDLHPDLGVDRDEPDAILMHDARRAGSPGNLSNGGNLFWAGEKKHARNPVSDCEEVIALEQEPGNADVA